MKFEKKAELLKDIDFLSFFHQSVLERLVEEAEEIKLNKGKELYKDKPPAHTLFVVLSGEVTLYEQKDRVQQLLPGDFFGNSDWAPEPTRSTCARASATSLLIKINDAHLKEKFSSQPQALTSIIKKISTSSKRNLATSNPDKQYQMPNGNLMLPLSRILSETSNETFLFDSNSFKFTHVNTGARKNLKYSLSELKEMTFLDITQNPDFEAFEKEVMPLKTGKRAILVFESLFKRKDSTVYPVEIRLQLSHTGRKLLFMATAHDISERKEVEKTIRGMAYYDALTGLPNRNLLNDRISLSMAHATRNKTMVGILFLDLDHFKSINDTLGHEAGDVLLKNVAKRLKQCLRRGDTVARIGGDEFIILANDVRHPKSLCTLAEKILDKLKTPVPVGKTQVNTATSIGIAVYPNDGENVQELIKQADLAMYRAKEKGRNTFEMFTPALQQKALKKSNLETQLDLAIEKNQFTLVYQPIVSFESGAIERWEALIDWQDDDLREAGPVLLKALNIKSRRILPLGEHVFRQIFLQMQQWQDAGFPEIHVELDLSILQFQQPDLQICLNQIAGESKPHLAHLHLNLLEDFLIIKPEATLQMLKSLRNLGIGLTLDRFGTGHTSLIQLPQLPVQNLKMDSALLEGQDETESCRAVARSIIMLAKELGFQCIANGVETSEHFEFLLKAGCHLGQGPYFSKPIAPGEVTEWLGEKKSFDLVK